MQEVHAMTFKHPGSSFLAQSAAAETWFQDATDRLHRHGAKRIAPDYYDMTEMTTEQMDAYIKETLEKKSAVVAKLTDP